MIAFVVSLLSAGIALWPQPRKVWRFLMWTVGFALLLGGGVIIDVIRRAAAIGAVNDDFRVFLSTKVDWHLVGRDLTFELGIAGAVALGVLLIAPRARRDPARYALFGLLATVIGFSYAWVVHFPWAYNRAPYYLPLLLSIAIGAAWTLVTPKWTLVGAAALIVAVSLEASDLAPVYRSYYGYVNRASLNGLSYVEHLVGPHGVVVTDTCWGFLSPWLLQRSVIAAQDPELIFPRTEIGPAETARKILYGGRNGATLAKRLNARWALIDPLCTHQTGALVRPPDIGVPVFASTRLIVLDLWAARGAGHPS
jgi:hypothetical protein